MTTKSAKLEESQTRELKTSFGEETIESIGAFANAKGGEVLIGVSPDGVICGVEIGKKTVEDWATRIRDATDPRLQPTIDIFEQNQKKMASIKVEASIWTPVSVRGRFFKRVGRTNQRMSHEEIMQRLFSSSGTSWDAYMDVGTSVNDLDLKAVRSFMKLMRQVKRRPLPEKITEIKVLEKLELIQGGLPTRAALLLFGKNPNRHFPVSYLKLGRFRSPTMIVDDKRVDGTIFTQIDECMGWFRERFQTEFVITGKPQRDVIWEYPLDAVREAVVNAICHRDYRVNTNIQVRLYDDRLEIWSPGGLPSSLTTDDLLEEHDSIPRNRLLADCLFYCGLIESWGSGTTRMASILTEAGLPLPVFSTNNNTNLHVIFRKEMTKEYLDSLKLSSNQIQLISQLKSEQARITNEQYQDEFSVSKRTASNDLSDLVTKKILLKHGTTGRGTYYTLPTSFIKGQQRGNNKEVP